MKSRIAKNHQDARRKLRRRLEAAGIPQHVIDQRVAAMAEHQRAVRAAVRAGVAPPPEPEPTADAPREVRLQAAARRAGVPLDQFDAHIDANRTATRLDDRGYKPTIPDPLARGAARVGSATLRAAQRSKATTKYEHDHQEMTQ